VSEVVTITRTEYERLLARLAAVEEKLALGNISCEPGEVRLKVWIGEEARRTGLNYHGIWNRIRRGRYPHLQIRKANQWNVFVSGGHLPPQFALKTGRKISYDFSRVDWSKPDETIALELGCHRTLVVKRRKELATK